MATKHLKFSGKPTEPRQQTGPFGQQDVVVIDWDVPEGAWRTYAGFGQILSDAKIVMTFQGKRKMGVLSASFGVNNPAAGTYSAVLTTDRDVSDCYVTVVNQFPRK